MPTISAREQSAALAELLRRERFALAEFLVALAEFDRGRGWEALNYASLFDYLHRDLALSKGAAYYRMTAARLIQAHPSVIEPLRDGRLCLTSIVELSKVLTDANRDEVLPRYFQLSKREAAAVTAELRPATVVPARMVVTRVAVTPAPALTLTSSGPNASLSQASVHLANQADLGQPVHLANQRPHDLAVPAPTPAPTPTPTGPRIQEQPLTAELSRLHLTVSRRLLAKLEEARAALSHSRPDATVDEIIEAGLDLLLERTAKRRGGPSTVDNLRCLCGRHNARAAREAYGDDWMERCADRKRRVGSP